MLPNSVMAAFLGLSLALFFVRSLYESKKSRRGKREGNYDEKEDTSDEPLIVLGAIFVLVFYGEVALYTVLALLGWQTILTDSFLQLCFPFDSFIQILGIAIMVFGYFLVFWSLHVIEYDRIVTWGPYRYVRHPMYVAYFFIFGGFFLTILNFIAIVPFIAIPAEVRMATIEEDFLTKKYGDVYIRYQQETGKFFPKTKPKAHH